MAVAPNHFQNGQAMLDGLVLLVLLASVTHLGTLALRGAALRLRPLTSLLRSPASLLGVAVTFASPTVAPARPASSPSLPVAGAVPPWSETSGFPPPRPLVRIGDARGLRAETDAGPAGPLGSAAGAHPAVHPGAELDNVRPLFPRAGHYDSPGDAVDRERRRSMTRHPSSTNPVRERSSCGRYVVRHGDTLWDIAARLLDTNDARRVARYWPRIHRLNRALIGPDPSLILPGMVLVLPDECAR